MAEYYAVIERNKGRQFFAYIPKLPGCQTCGETMGVLLVNLEEAVELYLEVVKQPNSRVYEHPENGRRMSPSSSE